VKDHGRKYRDGDSHPLPLWSGIMEHCRRIGPALWEFVWLIDKITEEVDGKGIVLGGAPIKIERIAGELDRCERTVRRNLDRLQDEIYIERTRTPYGFTIRVRNSRKFQIWSSKETVKNGRSLPVESGQKCPVSPALLSDLTGENVRNKEDAVVDATEDAAVEAAAAWRAVGTEKLGTSRFRARWEFSFAHRNGNPVSDAMERCIVSCQQARIPVPKPFYEAKRKVERGEAPPIDQGKNGQLEYLPAMPPLPCKS
jgi:DNA-binding Lrp family transcriptional regulator